MRTFIFGTVLAAGTIGLASTIATAQDAAEPHVLDHYTLIRCGHLLASAAREQKTSVTLIVKNDRVDRIVAGFEWPNMPDPTGHEVADLKKSLGAYTEIDLKQSWVLPGLIDCHVHLMNEWDKTVRARAMTESNEFAAVRGVMYARKTLEAGFTTVRDLGANSPQAIFALRDAIEQKLVMGPRIIAAGHWIAMTGGHGDHTNGYRADLIPQPTPEDGICDGPDECVKAVRNQIKLGADVIKVTATGGVLSASAAGLAQHFTTPELEAIVKTAHSLGRKVAAHAHGVDGINAAIRAGVDSIEHGTYLDDGTITLLKERGGSCYHVPTLLAAQTVFDNAHQPGYYLPMVARKALLVGPQAKLMFQKSHAAGVKIAFGTDTGVSPHGENAREFKLMVDAGMTPLEAITAATITASELLGLEKEIGTLEAGKAADVIAVAGDPMKDVTELERVKFVMRGGEVAKQTK
jgi:imidazolonepropionase-like amidohydrolase